MITRPSRGYVAAAFAAQIVTTSCGDDGGRVSTSFSGAGSATAVTSASASATDGSSTAPAPPTDGSASEATGTTSPVSGAPTGSEPTTGTSSTGTTGTTTTTTGTTTTSTNTTAADTTGTTSTSGAPYVGNEGCARVDFLFVIDDLLSMEGEQAALTAAFPAFITTIESTLPTDDYHIMVVDTDAASRCGPNMRTHETCHAANKHACMAIFDARDTTRGAGVVHPAGAFAANKVCTFPLGQRYLEASDPQLTANFECAAEVGTAGDPKERPMDAMVEAVSALPQAPGGLQRRLPARDEAILVVTFTSDDENIEDLNTAQQTYDALVAAKGGDADRIVMLGLIPGVGCGPGGLHWAQLITLFGKRGIQGQVCSLDYNGASRAPSSHDPRHLRDQPRMITPNVRVKCWGDQYSGRARARRHRSPRRQLRRDGRQAALRRLRRRKEGPVARAQRLHQHRGRTHLRRHRGRRVQVLG